jgi:hypothetical protein
MHVKKLIIKLLIFTAPIYLVVLFYIVTDPFKVIYHYHSYYDDNRQWGIVLNKDVISVESLLDNWNTYKYNSFIFGNSRSMFYHAAEWKKYIGDSASCFHMDANSESIYGIYRKFVLLDSLKIPITNSLIILDVETLGQAGNGTGHLFVKDYHLTGESWWSSQQLYFQDFITTPKFILACLDYKLTGHMKPYMFADRMLSNILVNYDERTNEVSFKGYDDSILHHRDAYYAGKKAIFYQRDTTESWSKPVVKAPQEKQLKAIAAVLARNHTRYKVIINPLYDQKKIAPEDLDILRRYFGSENVFDFSGVNSYTADKTNYYENSHYRPVVANDILRRIYQQPLTTEIGKN